MAVFCSFVNRDKDILFVQFIICSITASCLFPIFLFNVLEKQFSCELLGDIDQTPPSLLWDLLKPFVLCLILNQSLFFFCIYSSLLTVFHKNLVRISYYSKVTSENMAMILITKSHSRCLCHVFCQQSLSN